MTRRYTIRIYEHEVRSTTLEAQGETYEDACADAEDQALHLTSNEFELCDLERRTAYVAGPHADPNCYSCLGTGALQGFGVKPGIECPCLDTPDDPTE